MKRLDKAARNLEGQFFFQEDQALRARQQELARMERTRQSLSDISGITGKSVLDKLVQLEITPDLLATLAVLPLAEVAWADGRVQKKEREAVLEGAAACGIARGRADSALLEQWLRRRPPRKLMEAWAAYVSGLCESLSAAQRRSLADDLLSRARAVASAAGKLLGLGSGISAAEEALLAQMEKAFFPAE